MTSTLVVEWATIEPTSVCCTIASKSTRSHNRVDVHLLEDPIHVQPVDQGVDVDRGENLVEVGASQQGVDIDAPEHSLQIDAVEDPVHVDAVDEGVDVDVGEHRVQVDPLDQGVEVDLVEQDLHVEIVDQALHVDAVDDPLNVDPFDDLVDVDGVDDTGRHLLGDGAHDPGRPADNEPSKPRRGHGPDVLSGPSESTPPFWPESDPEPATHHHRPTGSMG